MPAAAVEFQDPAGDVVEEVAIVGHRHDRPSNTRPGAVRARRHFRHRGGWSVRRAAAGRAAASRILQSATRRRSPPESVVTSASPGGRFIASWRSRSADRAPRRRPPRSGPADGPVVESAFPWRPDRVTSPSLSTSWSNRSSRARSGATASSTLPQTSLSGLSCGSCSSSRR